ncbi:sugar ABC transporter ATP-binding protein [Mesorhizobium amorphae]|uniref:sugar ABC transporter ATP-binding protein n=1 Tax=Mesorhizobium amorphae TaxID=71433 RepID=UPI001783AC10|nr:sugar ABC transporter ATP-binding protein [Mesorhizobium amorphae]
MNDRTLAVDLSGVSKSFGETRALVNCQFSARAGEVHAIVGENGSGKSTLAKIISGVLREDSGEVHVLGATPRNPVEAQALGVATIFQEVLVADEASVIDNLYVGLDGLLRRKFSARQREQEARSLLKRFTGLDIDPSMPVGTLPLSIKQWIVICRAILRQPKLLILDESSAALDLDATMRLHGEISRLRDAGTCVLIVTHRISELVRIADRATVLRDGSTMGVLDKVDINEKNLLELMTPRDRHVSEADNRGSSKKAALPPLMSISDLRSVQGAEPINFKLEPGTIVGVTGLDGQGHERFIATAVGIASAHQGAPLVHLPDGSIAAIKKLSDAEALGVAYVSGDRKREGIFPDLSVFENLALGLYRDNLGPMGFIQRAAPVSAFAREVQRFSIKVGNASNKITSLSGGNQQKVLVARAFAKKPRLIVLNDPARGVDLGTKRDFYRELRAFADDGGAVIYLSSEIEEFIGFADRVDVFVDGGIFRSLTGDEIAEEPILAAMFGQALEAAMTFDMQRAAS